LKKLIADHQKEINCFHFFAMEKLIQTRFRDGIERAQNKTRERARILTSQFEHC
jgi:hypothetical protein